VRFVALLASALLLVPAPAAASTYISAHSHWDVDLGHPYTDFEFQVCYLIVGRNSAVAGSEIANLPMREVNGQNNMELRTRTDGFQLVYRVSGVAYTLASSLPNPHLTFGVGSDVMYDFVMVGKDFDLYQLNADGSRGAHWYHWVDSHYPSGVSASYYTIKGWQGLWDFVHGRPLNGKTGAPHDLAGLAQDARAHAKGGTKGTFDDPTPASGNVNGITGHATFGLPSGSLYTYTITATAGSGSFDFRDPGAADNSVFFTSGYYRLRLGTPATLQRFVGSTAGAIYKATAGGAGTYQLVLAGPDIYLRNAVGATILHVNDGGPQSGLRVRVTPSSGQGWGFIGTAQQ